ncbi:hypothetical protein K402DRAFT_397952 [Aulographum hederae CBS 113979]|uniref:Uncharacterized protein n=1 Tax=Aulographum hederae CBS 113979 TaxID=1176131 RepID=A0A6G1GMV4_9PEZI|nr:hypothetical protein K402DRAFT_397952 [Aulographum hederae CBS 113979]
MSSSFLGSWARHHHIMPVSSLSLRSPRLAASSPSQHLRGQPTGRPRLVGDRQIDEEAIKGNWKDGRYAPVPRLSSTL